MMKGQDSADLRHYRIAKCVSSLMKAVQEAGGKIDDRFLEITVSNLISRVMVPNGIVFAFRREDIHD